MISFDTIIADVIKGGSQLDKAIIIKGYAVLLFEVFLQQSLVISDSASKNDQEQ